jgi:hypothetical protein
MVAAAFAWVAIYSYAIHPGGSQSDYEAYAKVASPIVALVTGIPAFWAAGVVFRRRLGPSAVSTVIAMAALYLTMDVLIVATLAEDKLYNGLVLVANAVTKLAAVWVGVRGFPRPNGGATGGGG